MPMQDSYLSQMGFDRYLGSEEGVSAEADAPQAERDTRPEAESDSEGYLDTMGFGRYLSGDAPSGRSQIEHPGDQAHMFPDVEEVYDETPEWVHQQREGIQEAFNPAEVFAGIFSGGTTLALRHGAKAGVALGKGAAEAVVGTASDVPISLASQVVREKYGWGPAMVMELTAGLATGLTIEEYVLRKMGKVGRSFGRADSLKDALKKNPDELIKEMDELDKALNLAEDADEIMLALPPGKADTVAEQTFGDFQVRVNHLKTGADPIEAISVEDVAKMDMPPEAKEIAIDEINLAREQQTEAPSTPGRPKNEANQPVDLEARQQLIEQIVKARQKPKADVTDELAADVATVVDEVTPKLDAEVPKPRVMTQAQKNAIKAQDDIEEFLGIKMEKVQEGEVRPGDEDTIGFDDALFEHESLTDLPDDLIDELEMGTRTWDDVLTDMYTVFGRKIGMTVEDVSQNSADTAAAVQRLAEDLKKHERKALRQGLKLQDYYEQMGFSPDIAAKWTKYTEHFHKKGAITKETKAQIEKGDKEQFKGFLSHFSVEHPFRKIGAPESGFALKNRESLIDMYSEEGLGVIEKMRKDIGLTDSDAHYAVLRAEDPNFSLKGFTKDQALRIEGAAKMWNDYAKKSFNEYKAAGILDDEFPKSAIMRREDKIRSWKKQLEGTDKPERIARLNKNIMRAEKEISQMEGKNYVPVVKMWFDKLEKTDPSRFSKILKLHGEKIRKSTTISALLENELIKPEELDIRDLVGYYSRRKGQDLAESAVRNALEKEGLITRIKSRDIHGNVIKKKKSDWAQLDVVKFPAYKDFAVHPAVRGYLEEYYRSVGRHSKVEQFMNTTKMFQFINPVIMPMYDLYQTAMMQWRLPHNVPSNFKDGFTSYLKGDEDYWAAVKNGLFSKPYANPIAKHNQMIDKAKYGSLSQIKKQFDLANLPMKERLTKVLKGVPQETLRGMYNLSWDLAWRGDGMIRMVTYKSLRKEGLSERDAAQMAALFHGDYASVPPAMRKKLNKVFFTPTFKIAMLKAQTEMTKAAVDSATKFGKFKLPNKKTQVLAGGLVGAIAANWGKDMLMTNLGFESDTWGRRYKREVETDEGVKDIVVTFSDPTNVILKYMQSAYEVSTEPVSGDTTPWGRFIQSAQHEVHPAIRIGLLEMTKNEKWNGTRMYSPNDPTWKKGAKSMEYLTGQIVPMLQIAGLGDRDSEDDEIIKKEFGQVWNKLSRLVIFPYVRESSKGNARRMSNQIKQNIMSDIERGAYTEERQAEAQKQLQHLWEYIDEQHKR